MSEHKKFIDGSWYEEQYSTPGSRYYQTYAPPAPAWARDANLFHVRMTQAMVGGGSKRLSVLELGAGVGRQLRAWKRAGAGRTVGVEISAAAVKQSGMENIHVRSAADLSCFDDGEFDLVYSNAFMEHVAREITAQVLQESVRVGRWGAHWIPMDAGNDPSHIHIQSREQWIAEMLAAVGTDYAVGCIENPVDATQPLFLIARRNDMPWPMTCIETFRLRENQ